MGFRTVVILFNDQSSEWASDPELGKRIQQAASDRSSGREMGFGRVVEECHADQQTLAVLDSYDMKPIAHSHWVRGQDDKEVKLKLLKEAAASLGYRLTKIPS